LGSLDRRRLAVVRELYYWREETAARTNRPTRAICRDDLMAEIARRNPTRERDLLSVRGLPRRDLEGILAAVTRARQLAIEQCPAATERDQDPPQVGLVSSVLAAVLGDYCGRHRLAPNLVASGNDLKLLVRGQIQNGKAGEMQDSSLAQGWRAQHVLPMLRAILEGRQSVRVADVASETPLAYDNS
jgi:ribonuclease D